MARLRVEGLPEGALEAAAVFHAKWLPKAIALLSPLSFRAEIGGGDSQQSTAPGASPHPNPSPEGEGLLTLIFPAADHRHTGWRLAAVQSLAREYTPARINAIASDDEAAISAALAYLEAADGVTGQYLPLDDAGAGTVV